MLMLMSICTQKDFSLLSWMFTFNLPCTERLAAVYIHVPYPSDAAAGGGMVGLIEPTPLFA